MAIHAIANRAWSQSVQTTHAQSRALELLVRCSLATGPRHLALLVRAAAHSPPLSLCISCCPICLRLLLSFTPDPPSQCGIESSCLLVPALVSCLQGCRTRRLWPDLLLLLFLFPTPDSQTRPDIDTIRTHTHSCLHSHPRLFLSPVSVSHRPPFSYLVPGFNTAAACQRVAYFHPPRRPPAAVLFLWCPWQLDWTVGWTDE